MRIDRAGRVNNIAKVLWFFFSKRNGSLAGFCPAPMRQSLTPMILSTGDARGPGRWFALLIEYDGGGFAGWQRQPRDGVTVQAVLEDAPPHLADGRAGPLALPRRGARMQACMRLGQVAHLDIARDHRPDRQSSPQALNFHLKPHRGGDPARGAGGFRRLERAVFRHRATALPLPDPESPAPGPPWTEGRAWHVRHAAGRGRDGGWAPQQLLGRHDFTSFRASGCQAKSPVRTLERLDVTREGDVVTVRAEARSFLHHQVRNIVGTLKLVGEGYWPPERVAVALAERRRGAAGPTAPPDGLFLVEVAYPNAVFG